MTWIQTAHGYKFDLLQPTVDMINVADIAYSLANIARFNGHAGFYSVAQHSVYVASCTPAPYKLHALLHDAAEAYVGDMTTPLKQMLPDFQSIEDRIWRAIADAFGLAHSLPWCIKEADFKASLIERNFLMGPPPEPWHGEDGVDLTDMPVIDKPWTPDEARRTFLRFYHGLTDAPADCFRTGADSPD